MTPRTRKRIQRNVFRLVLSLAFFVWSSPNVHADTNAGATTKNIKKSNKNSANNATVKIKCRRTESTRRISNDGAGVIISADGYIVTAYHVVRGFIEDGNCTITVTTSDGDVLRARHEFHEAEWDIAMIKLVNPGKARLVVAPIADSQTELTGRKVWVIGNPLGQGQTIEHGTLGDTRTVNWDGNRAQLMTIDDAPIIEGNSGGGAFDEETGELVGITVARSSVKENTGFMVPVDRLVAIVGRKSIVAELDDSKEIYDNMGVRMRDVSLVDGQFEKGMLVTSVKQGSIAWQAGWRVGDVLVGLDKYQTNNMDSVLYVLRDGKRAETEVSYMLARGDSVDKGTIKLDGSSAKAASAKAAERQLAGVR